MNQPAETVALIRYDAMCLAIAECHRVDEVKDLRDRARAIQVYARQAQNFDAERKAAEIRIRAERKAGELLKEMKATGQRKDSNGRPSKASNSTTLTSLGITRDQSSKWQQLAEIPQKEFEAELAKPGPPMSTEGLINSRILAANPTPRIDPLALYAWGHLKDFERKTERLPLLEVDLADLYPGMTETMKEDIDRAAPQIIDWLSAFLKSRRRRNGSH